MYDSILILFLMISSVFLIVSDKRFRIEKKLKEKYMIEREWWIPPISLLIGILLGVVTKSHIIGAFSNDLEIIVLVFSLAFISQGFSYSNFFRYLAYRIVRRANGNTFRLLIYMFLFTSVSTLLTTNDLVILILTPIIIEIGYQINIKNLIPLLLPQFIIANTLSMGLLIGSPTNIVISSEVNLDFIEYFLIMLFPTIISFISVFIVFYVFMSIDIERIELLESFEFDKTYTVPNKKNLNFNNSMKIWALIFLLMIISITIVTFYNLSLYWCSLPVLAICSLYWYISDSHSKVRKPIKKLPYGIFFFGMSFFIFAEAFSGTPLFNSIVSLVSGFETNQLFPLSLLGSGIVVNIFNDLPASALIAQILSEITFENNLVEIITYQAILSGLNIGKYLTQIGALAGILWFSVINVENKKQKKRYNAKKDKKLPKRTDLVKYGVVNFVVNSIALILFFTFLLYVFGP